MKGSDLRPEILRPFDARHVPMPVPAPDLCDAPTVTICVNSSWWSHLEGQISRLLFRDAWAGTDEEIERAILQIEEVLTVGKANPMGCGCGCNQSILTRFNPDTGRLEQSTDGGATWTPAPDPRYDNPVSPNPYGGTVDEIKCLAAANVAAVAKAQADELIANSSAWGSITLMIPALLAFIGWLLAIASFGTLTPIALALTGALIHAGSGAFAAAMTTDVYNTFACIVYCHIQADGTFSQGNLDAIKADILDQLNSPPSIAAKFLGDFVGLLGIVGMGNAAHSGYESTANCEDCGCAGGCIDDSFVILGNVIDQDEFSITLEAVVATRNAITAYWVVYGSADDSFCCLMCDQSYTPDVSSGGWTDCDGTPHPTGSPIGEMVRSTEFYRTGAGFQATFVFAGAEGCPPEE